MNTIVYGSHGVEIEDDLVRLRRRKLEFEHDAARCARRSEPRRGQARGAVRATSALIARWRLQRSWPS